MIVAEQSLINKQPFDPTSFVSISRKFMSTKWRESFQQDCWVNSVHEERVEMPLSFHSTEESTKSATFVSSAQQSQSDIPSLNLGSRHEYAQPPFGYHCKPLMGTSTSHQKSHPTESKSINDQCSESTDPRATAWEILELSNSRVNSGNSSLRLYSSLYNFRCDTTPSTVESQRTVSHGYTQSTRHVASPLTSLDDGDGNLGCFMMMRLPGSTPERHRPKETESMDQSRKDEADANGGKH